MRRWLLILALNMSPAMALADPVTDSVIAQLRAQGYSRFTVERTLLGRVRIEAEGRVRWREIVFNPQTGEILRDYSEALDRRDRATVPRLLVDADDDRSGRGGGDEDDDEDRSGRRGGDDDRDDDESDDDEEDDDRDDDDDEDDDDRSGRGGGDDDDDDDDDDD